MKALQFSSFGSPTAVVELAEIEPADPGRGQLAVAIEAAPINPSHLTLIKGVYAQAQLAGSSRVYWQTHETNHTAMQLYDKVAEKSGFVVYRRMF